MTKEQNALDIVADMEAEPTLDHFYDMDPRKGTSEEREERLSKLIELHRRDRAVFIQNAKDKRNKKDGHVPAEEISDDD